MAVDFGDWHAVKIPDDAASASVPCKSVKEPDYFWVRRELRNRGVFFAHSNPEEDHPDESKEPAP